MVYPPIQFMDVETPRPDGSLGPLYLASALESKGIETDILDSSVGAVGYTLANTYNRNVRQANGLTRIGMSFEEIAQYVAKGNYDVVGIHSNFTPQTNMAFQTAEAIKRANPNIKVYTGGINARSLKDRFLRTGYFDGVCLTEGELIFPAALLNGVENTPGWAYIINREIKVNPTDETCFPKSLDDLAMPAWEKLPFEKYDSLDSKRSVITTGPQENRYGPIMTSRGCPFECDYCHISREKSDTSLAGSIGKLRLHSEERVLKDICKLKSLGVRKLFFEDDSLLAKKKRVKNIFRQIAGLGFSISDINGVNLVHFHQKGKHGLEIDREYLEILRDAGFDQIVFPIESGSQRVLDTYATGKNNLTTMDFPLLMRTMTNMGIRAPANMMIGFPDETEEEMQQSIELAHKLMDSGAPYVTFFIPIPFPGSKLFDIAIVNNYLPMDFNTDVFNWKRPVMRNTTVPPERIEEIRDEANEKVNTKQHLEMRLKASVGYRWVGN